MGKKRRGIDDENGDVQGQKVDKPNDVMKEDVSKSNHKKKKKRDKVEKRTPHEYANTTDVQEMMESPRKKKKRSHDKLKEEDANGESLEDFTEDVKTCKKKKHKHRDKVETTESTLPKSNHSLEDEDRPKKKKKKKLNCDIETIEEPTLSEDVPVNDTEFEESVVIPKKKKKRKHDKEETTFLEDVGEVQCEETAVIPEKKRKKKKHDKTEKVPSGDDPGEVDFEDTEVVHKKKKKKKKKHEKDECPSDERNETVTVDKSSEDEDAIDPPKEKSKAETEVKDDIDEETRQKLKQDWQDKTSLKKLRMQQPKMFLIDNFTNDEDPKMTFKPVGVQDLQDLVQYTVMGNAANTNRVRFCKVIRPALIPKVAVIVLNGVTDEHYQKHPECFAHLSQNHDLTGQILHQVPSQQQQSVLNQLLHLAISKKQLKKRAYLAKVHGVPTQTGIGATPKATPLPARASPSATPHRTHYLLDDEQKAIWRYPRPDDPEYTHTKHSETVGDNSPLISVDCEMCVTKKGSELTRVSLVDEKHNVLYNSLVKPNNPIIDYVTRYSGITKQLLDPVTVRLEDVQRAILALLPSDAILVGQSLENDLRALKLYHPHVIDTSNLFTGSYRVALRKLAWKYLGVKIQERETGHDSVEDAIVALKLLQLKLEKGSTIEKYTSNGTRRPGIELIPTESLFRCAQPLRRVCMLIDSLAVAKQFMKDPVGAIPCQNDSEALKKTVQSVPYSDFVCVQFYNFFKLTQGISQEADVVKETLKQLDQRIKQIYKTLPFNSFFLVVMAADPNHSNTKGENVKDSMPKGRFFTGLKLKY